MPTKFEIFGVNERSNIGAVKSAKTLKEGSRHLPNEPRHAWTLTRTRQSAVAVLVGPSTNANHSRPNTDGLRSAGHQASSAFVATIMSELYSRCCGRRTASR